MVNLTVSDEFLILLLIFRPGFVRFNLAYFMDGDTVDFVLQAVRMVAMHGWKLLPQVNDIKF